MKLGLVEAFAALEPHVPGDEAGNARRAAAARVVLEFLSTEGKRVALKRCAAAGATAEEVEDAIAETLKRLLKSGSRRPELGTESQVRGYLIQGLENNVIGEFRRRIKGRRIGRGAGAAPADVAGAEPGAASPDPMSGRPRRRVVGLPGVPAGDDEDGPGPAIPAPEPEIEPWLAGIAREEALAALHGRVVPWATDGLHARYRSAFAEDVADLIALAADDTTFEALVRSRAAPGEGGTGGTGAADERGGAAGLARARQALYKRHERARTRLLEATAELERGGEISADLAEALRGFVEFYLNRRQ